eukprot:SAG31_NODE_1012_length_10379_cov_3.699319_3_plen_130_part_00
MTKRLGLSVSVRHFIHTRLLAWQFPISDQFELIFDDRVDHVFMLTTVLHEAQLALEADHRKKEEFWAEHERLEQQIEAAKDAIDDAEQNITATRGVCRSLGGRLGLKIDERHLLDSRARQEALAAASSR